MKFSNVNLLRETHDNFDEEILYLDELFNDFLIFHELIIHDCLSAYLSADDYRMCSKKCFMKNRTKQCAYYVVGRSGDAHLVYDYGRDGILENVEVKGENIINSVSKSKLFDSIAINYVKGIERVSFKADQKLYASLYFDVANSEIVVCDYSLDTDTFIKMHHNRTQREG